MLVSKGEVQSDLFEAVFRNIDVGMAVLGRKGEVVVANEAFASLLRRPPSEVADSCIFEFVSAPRRLDFARDFNHFVGNGARSRQVETDLDRADGSHACVVATLCHVPEGVDSAGVTVALFSDVTEEVEALRELREREEALRRAYGEVVMAVTGGRLLIVSSEQLTDQLGEPVLGPIHFSDETGPGEIRRAVRSFVASDLPGVKWEPGFEVAFGEAMLNALKHSGGGEFTLYTYNKVLQACISDSGTGIDFSTIARYTIDTDGNDVDYGLGVGFMLMLSFTSRIMLATGVAGTTLVLESLDGRSLDPKNSKTPPV